MTTQVRTAHLLIKHTESRNPVSRRTNSRVTLTPQEARQELQEYYNQILAEGMAIFPEVARARSDCGSFQSGGDLGMFGRGMMQKPFEDASFGLKVGEMSGIVETDSGLHLIYRIE
mmetsp:Transcript_6723/g.8390  ORF Transcript_6723/g.8390 Transcript_6723/m.8390 type:complete len:116 (+) Transcript_6723:81-428(+)|eukprot:CAMPEP_0203674730 /NCGR_PEP_ID=MMETSP0090-20130426/17057_1 /ASSEMBLY_ACC=CAM_ASM_001088 /TAXON_ID=426623 /ORGANISM="Chaetoceros affinis, Strain CCMP159" /LENGTH=115 /DNA_ID=CAMNT_0050540685 /DNA_START=24 /DNA_END=371 /DNA_ORIENTATION=+